jgi:hypothetical protein
MIMRARQGYKVTADEVKEDISAMRGKAQLLDMEDAFWMQFIKDRQLNEQALIAAGYSAEGQVEWLRGEMRRLGWISQ